MTFFQTYIDNENFNSGELNLENDSWGATADWVRGAIGNLLAVGMQSDNHAFDLSYLPIAKKILKSLVYSLKTVDDFKRTNMDFPTYSLNSVAGKVLRSLLHYSLRSTRTLSPEQNQPKWEEDVKVLMEQSFRKEIVDSYILTGWYFEQWYFLDQTWIIDKVKEFYQLKEDKWIAFISGFSFGNPPFNKEIYQLFYPHYERVIQNDIHIKKIHQRGIVNHIVAFYFWGFEDLKKGGLLLMILEKNNRSTIVELINFVWRQNKYFGNSNSDEAQKFQKIILDLWKYLAAKYENATEEEDQKILATLSNLLEFAPELNEDYTELVLKSLKIPIRNFYSYHLIENLAKLKDEGEQRKTAKYLGAILNSIQFPTHFFSRDNKNIGDLVEFLYQNQQKEIADEFCNKRVRQGDEFLMSIYNKYKDS